jgi:DNA-binding transcriptional LysR family regulator
MQIENFKIFADLVETKSFSKSAKLNGITQSAVSQQARAMERHFKALLVDRSQKQFQLTREGQKVYESAKDVLHAYETLLSELQEMKKVVSGTIRISTIYSIGLHELPPYIKKFLHDFPSVNVRVEYRRSNLVYEDILHNCVDFGLVAFPAKMRQIETIPFRNDHLIVICTRSTPGQEGEVSVAELAGQKFIGFDPDIPTRKAVDQIFRDNKLEIETVMEFDNIETVKRAVEIDHGIAIVPQATVVQEAKQGTLAVLRFKGGGFTRPLAILHRKGRVLTPAMKKFIEILGLDLPEARRGVICLESGPVPRCWRPPFPSMKTALFRLALAPCLLAVAPSCRPAPASPVPAPAWKLKDVDGKPSPGTSSRGRWCPRLLGDLVPALQDGDPGLHRAPEEVRGRRPRDRRHLRRHGRPGGR